MPTKSESKQVRISEQLHRRAKLQSYQEGRSISDFVEEAIEARLKRAVPKLSTGKHVKV